MLPFLGHGDTGAERGAKLALIGELPLRLSYSEAHLVC